MQQLSGKISWFNDHSTASGIPADSKPGIAVANSSTMGGWWLLKLANGKSFVAQQIDWGPAAWTNRVFDFSQPLQAAVGNPATDSTASGTYLGKSVPSQYKHLVIGQGGMPTNLGAGGGAPVPKRPAGQRRTTMAATTASSSAATPQTSDQAAAAALAAGASKQIRVPPMRTSAPRF